MNTIAVALVLLGAFLCQYVDANEKCKEGFMKFKEALNVAIDDSECGKKFELEKYKCTGGEDREKDKAAHKEFKKMVKELDDPKKEDLMNCLDEIGGTAYGSIKEELPEECQEKMEEAQKKMKEMLMGHE